MRWWIAAAAFLMCVPAQAEPAASAPARAFAVAWVDRETNVSFGRLALEEKLATCIKRGMIAPDVLAAERPLLDLYLDTLFEGTARVQDKVAVKAQALLAPADLTVLAKAFSTPTFRAFRRQAVARMMDKIVPAVPGCGDQAHQVTVGQLGAGLIPHLTKAQFATLSKLFLSPAGQHFTKAAAQLMATLTEAYRDEVEHALQVTGASPEAQRAARAIASPLVMDPPIPAPTPHP